MCLKPKQSKALAALLDTGSITGAAEAAGVTRETLHSWLRDDEFKQALRAAEDEAIRTMTIRLTANTDAAITKVVDIMNDPTTPRSVALRAADTVLGRVLELRELTIVEERLASIETALALRNGR